MKKTLLIFGILLIVIGWGKLQFIKVETQQKKGTTAPNAIENKTSEKELVEVNKEEQKVVEGEIKQGEATWTIFKVHPEEKTSQPSSYELWFTKNGKEKLVTSWPMSSFFNKTDWGLNGEHGIRLSHYEGYPEGGFHHYIIVDEEGYERLNIVQNIPKEFEFTLRVNGVDTYEVQPILSVQCWSLYKKDGHARTPTTEITGLQFSSESVESENIEFLLDTPISRECDFYDDAPTAPTVKITQFDKDSIELALSDNQKARINLSPTISVNFFSE